MSVDDEGSAPDTDPGTQSGEEPEPDGLTRRQVLIAGGLGGGLLLGGGVFSRTNRAAQAGESYGSGGGAGHAGHADLEALGIVRQGYGHGPVPPRDLDEDMIAALTYPPEADRSANPTTREFELPLTERTWNVAEGASMDAWVYGGQLPGPVIRATEGDRVVVHVPNRTSHGHNLHLHGSHDPQMDGWEPIPAGQSFTYEVEARPAGLHPYHCHTPPLAEHVRRGLYGAMIVDPPGGREPALEVVLVLGGFDLDGDGHNELYGFNGVCGLYDRHPIKVAVDQLVRVYLVNMVEGEPVASFHLHAQTFDVYRSGTSATPQEHTDQVTLAQGDRAVLEFRLPSRGRYMFHPHQHHMAERGAMGWFTAV